MFRFALAALLLTATAAQAETYDNLKEFILKTNKLGLDARSTECYADAVVAILGRNGALTGGLKGDIHFNELATNSLETEVLLRQWKMKKMNTLGDLIHHSCPDIAASDSRRVETLHPLAELPNVSK